MTGASPQILTVEWMGPSLNKIYTGTHWGSRTKWAADGHLAVLAAVRKAKIKPVHSPVCLTFSPHIKGRRYDTNNYALAVKIMEDGLVKAGVLQGDTVKYVWRVSTDAPVKTKKQSYMIITIEVVVDVGGYTGLSSRDTKG